MTLTNADLLARFDREHCDRHSISPARRKKARTILLGLAEGLDGRTLVEMSPSDLMAWQGAMLKRGISPNSVRNYESMVRAFLGWAYSAQLIPFELSMQLKSVTSCRGARVVKPKPYKKADIQRLRITLEARYPLAPVRGRGSRMVKRFLRGETRLVKQVYCHARRLQLEAQIALALETGLRATEIWHLTLAQMHPDNAGVVVFTAKSKPGEVREREVPYTNHARLVVQEWLDFRSVVAPGHERPWLTLTAGRPRGELSFGQFEKALHPLGRPYFNWHRLRHTFATERLRAGMPLEKLQVMMGHANLSQTLAYAEIVNADVRSEADRTEDQFARNLGLVA